MPNQIALYEDMSALSARMVEAARQHDWDELISLEASVSALRETLMVDDDSIQLSPQDTERKRMLIQRILRDDAEVRRHTEPWMEHLRQFLGNHNRRRQLDRAYSAGF